MIFKDLYSLAYNFNSISWVFVVLRIKHRAIAQAIEYSLHTLFCGFCSVFAHQKGMSVDDKGKPDVCRKCLVYKNVTPMYSENCDPAIKRVTHVQVTLLKKMITELG